ncbi:GAF domain-containing protein [Actinopolymorpha rutila]|uniref:GAF domain-containing protein n=1 Tax=Actinopolymorpha rutila TaxID=446787 RepID=A0A852ZJR3_9ACTN|nr:GAF domain-containing protein [Actinopolymorpha rutila]NYH92483.1 GAF domain-containing protein [Actinopolymorpha rutila]
MSIWDGATARGQKETRLSAQDRLDGPECEVVPVLRGILISACQLTDAAYGVVLLADSDRHVTNAINARITEHQLSVPADLPGMDAFFAALLAAPQPLVLNDMHSRRADYSIPSAHPDVTSLAGSPVHPREGPPGYLYLALEHKDKDFSPDDVRTIVTLAATDGLVVDTLRHVTDRPGRLRWIDAITELIRLLHGDVGRKEGLQSIADLLREAAGADTSVTVLADRAEEGQVIVEAASGLGAHLMSGTHLPRARFCSEVMDSGQPIVSEDVTKTVQFTPPAEWVETLSVLGPGLIIPLATLSESLGAMFISWRRDSPKARHATRMASLAIPFAQAAALVLQRYEAQQLRIRKQRWMDASGQMARLLIDQVDRDEAMDLVIHQLRKVSGADFGGIMLVDPTDSTVLRVVGFQGPGIPPVSADTWIPRSGLVARVMRTGRRIVSDDYPHQEGHHPPAEWREALSTIGLGMAVPLIVADEDDVLGVLFAGWRRDSPDERMATDEVQEVQTFADLAALALQRVRAQDNREQLHLLEDHVQIAHNLHDAVLQRLFAVGLRLQSASAVSTEPPIRHRVQQAISDLDETTEQVRQTIEHLARDGSDER